MVLDKALCWPSYETRNRGKGTRARPTFVFVFALHAVCLTSTMRAARRAAEAEEEADWTLEAARERESRRERELLLGCI